MHNNSIRKTQKEQTRMTRFNKPRNPRQPASGPAVGNRDREPSRIGKTLTITGQLKSGEPVTVLGTIQGNIHSSDHITIGKEGTFDGEINANSVTILGKARGEINAREKLEIRRHGRLEGNLITRKLIVEDGALFNGKSQMDQTQASPPSGEQKPDTKASPVGNKKPPSK